MRLYSGMSREFVQDSVRNQLADKLRNSFFAYYRYEPSPSEINSWRNSLRAMAQVIDHAKLHDQGIFLEFQLPLSSKRLDCMVCGRDDDCQDRAVIIELKQWEKCERLSSDKLVQSWVGGRQRAVLHPSVQVGQYRQYLSDTHAAFNEGENPISLDACAYLHNYTLLKDDPILERKFDDAVRTDPIFDSDAVEELSDFLNRRLRNGSGRDVLARIEGAKYRPSRKLMDFVANTIRGHSPWVLIDEQLVVHETILELINKSIDGRKKQVVIVRGGPGTGKSVLAINLLATLLARGKNAHYATGSKAFTETLWDRIGSRSRATIKYFNSYGKADYNTIDALICDEAHRIRATSNNRFTKKENRSNKAQIRELLEASKISIFFIDDRQVVRPNEIGSVAYINEQAAELGAGISEFELEVQFRCAGSEGFVNWIDNTLAIRKTANVIWEGAEGFDFQIFSTPESLDSAIRTKAEEGFSARIAAGFCWPWSEAHEDGTLVDDVVIGQYKRPWDAKPGSTNLAPGIPSASLWATDPNGIDQIGCVYNIQGFELDYVGVIFGPDLVYDFDKQAWKGDIKKSADSIVKRSKENFVELVKNTYRVLLSRGMKGCYVYFMDRSTEMFVRSRMEWPQKMGSE